MAFQVRKFIPHPLLRSGHTQTIAGHLSFPSVSHDYETLAVKLNDEDLLNLHIDNPQSTGPLVLLMHGLGGCSESRYKLRLSPKLAASGATVIRLNHRGCGRGGVREARQIYHAGRTSDIECALDAIKQRFGERPLFVVGFSLSGNMLLLLAGSQPQCLKRFTNLKGIMAVCPPVDLASCARALTRLDNFFIDQYFSKLLAKTARVRLKEHPDGNHPELPRFLTLSRIDEYYTAPQAGFANRHEYYQAYSAKSWLSKIEVDATIICADNDPVIPKTSFKGVKLSQSTRLFCQEGGGHMGFISKDRTTFGDNRWLDEQIVEWVVDS